MPRDSAGRQRHIPYANAFALLSLDEEAESTSDDGEMGNEQEAVSYSPGSVAAGTHADERRRLESSRSLRAFENGNRRDRDAHDGSSDPSEVATTPASPWQTSTNWRASARPALQPIEDTAFGPRDVYENRQALTRGHRQYVSVSGPRTRDGIPWESIRRGTIVKSRDVRRYWGNEKKAGDDGIVTGPDGNLWMDKERFFLVKDRYWSSLDARAIYSHGDQGLTFKSNALKQQSMCILPHDPALLAHWTNEAHPNDALSIKWFAEQHQLSPVSSIYVSESISKDIEEEYDIVGEIEGESMEKMEALEEVLKRKSRGQS